MFSNLFNLFFVQILNMGLILSQFRKKKTLLTQLEDLEEEIRSIEQYATNLDANLRSAHNWIIVSGSVIVLMSSLYIYFFRYPKDMMYKIIFLCALASIFTLTLFINRLTSWYYFKQIKSNRTKIRDLQKAKKKILEEVEEKENYKTAKEILEKFAPERSPLRLQSVIPKSSSNMAISPLRSGTNNSSKSRQETLISSRLPAFSSIPTSSITPTTYPLPKSFVERAVEFLLGDGPSNRYALICNKCSTHNGMALKEEYPFISFKCYVCKEFNPSKQVKLQQPKLEWNPSQQTVQDEKSTSDVKEKPVDANLNENEIEDTVDTQEKNKEEKIISEESSEPLLEEENEKNTPST